jgi:hypothetical protein
MEGFTHMNPTGYAAIRKNEEHEWLDMGTFSGDMEWARSLAAQTDHRAGISWAKANPVIGWAMVKVTVIRDVD